MARGGVQTRLWRDQLRRAPEDLHGAMVVQAPQRAGFTTLQPAKSIIYKNLKT
jgi:hypothetical protein